MIDWRDRIRAFGIHGAISLCVAAIAFILVFFVWYPSYYREISGGRELFWILITVDVILGPLLTLSVFDRRKSFQALAFDLSVIGLVQLIALSYGLWTVFVARPVHLVFEYDQYRVAHAVEVPVDLLDKTPPGIVALPLAGPTVLSLRPTRGNETFDIAMAELAGAPACARPDLWQPYEMARTSILQKAKPVTELLARLPDKSGIINHVIKKTGRPTEQLRYLPLRGRNAFWTALIDPQTTEILGVIPLDPY